MKKLLLLSLLVVGATTSFANVTCKLYNYGNNKLIHDFKDGDSVVVQDQKKIGVINEHEDLGNYPEGSIVARVIDSRNLYFYRIKYWEGNAHKSPIASAFDSRLFVLNQESLEIECR